MKIPRVYGANPVDLALLALLAGAAALLWDYGDSAAAEVGRMGLTLGILVSVLGVVPDMGLNALREGPIKPGRLSLMMRGRLRHVRTGSCIFGCGFAALLSVVAVGSVMLVAFDGDDKLLALCAFGALGMCRLLVSLSAPLWKMARGHADF